MNAFAADFLYAFRIFYKRPGLSLLSILALSVSLGMSTGTFAMLNGLFFKPLPFPSPEELHTIYLENNKSETGMMPVPGEQLGSLKSSPAFSGVMGYYSGTINISGAGTPERYDGAFVSPNFLEVLGHAPVLGRSLSPGLDGTLPPPELLISHELWQTRFHGDPAVLGVRVRANGADHRIVGVLPENFHFPLNAQVWAPLSHRTFPGGSQESLHVVAVGRLAPGVALQKARAELAALYQDWESSSLEEKENLQLTCEPFGLISLNKASRSIVVVFVSAVIFILLISCANVANLLIGRALTRGREMAIRVALGATRRRILRQLLTESLVLSFCGTIGGLLFAAWTVDFPTQHHIWKELPYWMSFELDWRVFLFAFGIMVATTLVSGLVPAWQSSKTDLNEMLKDTSHTSTSFRLGRLTRGLAVIQLAFACALLFGAGLVTRNVLDMRNLEPGFAAGKLLTMRMGLFLEDYPEEADRDAFYARLREKVNEIPGVAGSAVSSWLGQFGNYKEPFLPKGHPPGREVPYAYMESISGDYFQTLGLSVLEGRTFTPEDTADGPRVVIVNQAFVDKSLSGTDPLGQELNIFMNRQTGGPVDSRPWRIVGVVPTIRVSNFTNPRDQEAIIYTPYTQTTSPFMTLLVDLDKASADQVQKDVQEVILALDPHLPVYFSKTMQAYMDEQIQPYRLLANFLLVIGLMALFLAAIGVYGMLAFNVSRRRREIGIRMALGANARRIVAQVLQQGFSQVIMGITVGTGLAYLVGQLTKNFLLGINPTDPSIFAGVLLTLVGVATLAFFIPARRAARLSPMEALRYE